jgi:hypothetical protein
MSPGVGRSWGTSQTGTPDAAALRNMLPFFTVQVRLQPRKPKKYNAGIWCDEVLVEDMGDTAAAFFQAIVDDDENTFAAGGTYNGVRLVHQSLKDQRTSAAYIEGGPIQSWILGAPPRLSLADELPILIACQGSLDELNRRLEKNDKPCIEMSRFRPNIVISGSAAFEEDQWKYIAIGDQLFATAAACPRCKQTCVDPETGKVGPEPLATLKTFRACIDQCPEVYFGITATPLGRSGTVRLGDPVRILEQGDVWYPEDD